jgi:alpha-tubulin suppressor-like RCC1 family protein
MRALACFVLAACSFPDPGIGLSNLTYSSNPAYYPTGHQIQVNMPTLGTGTGITYSVEPTLPPELHIAPTTGIIFGMPFAPQGLDPYTVTVAGKATSGGTAFTDAVVEIGIFTLGEVAVGTSSCAIVDRSTISVECWGSADALGNNATAPVSAPTPINTTGSIPVASATHLVAGNQHVLALVGGDVWCWGVNSAGQCGQNPSMNPSFNFPVFVMGGGKTVAIAAGAQHSCLLDSTGTAYCWGNNQFGQLGNGTTVSGPAPVQVGLSNIKAIAAGGSTTCAITQSGAVSCWGFNAQGELGNNSTTNSSTPVTVSGVTGATSIAVGGTHACAIAGQALYCWGANSFGQLGNNTMQEAHTATMIRTPITAVSAGFDFTCAIGNGGALCWGNNQYGQLGDGTTTQRLVPTPIGPLSGMATTIGAGQSSACATVDGILYCWGANSAGQLGNGTTMSSSMPGEVATL